VSVVSNNIKVFPKLLTIDLKYLYYHSFVYSSHYLPRTSRLLSTLYNMPRTRARSSSLEGEACVNRGSNRSLPTLRRGGPDEEMIERHFDEKKSDRGCAIYNRQLVEGLVYSDK
jgi:hypothetical protein